MSESSDIFGIGEVFDAVHKQQQGFEMAEEIRNKVETVLVTIGTDLQKNWRKDPPVELLRECQAYQEDVLQRAANYPFATLDLEKRVYVKLIIITVKVRKHLNRLQNGERENL